MKNLNIPDDHVVVSKASERIEVVSGAMIALFAALLAISDLVGKNVENQRKKAELSHSEVFSWYQSKSTKQNLKENHLQTIELMASVGLLKKGIETDKIIEDINSEIVRYKKEKKELMVGSKFLPKELWTQDIDGKLGQIVGFQEWEKLEKKLNLAEDKFDISNLFFQISLVIGAVCIIIYDNPKLQNKLLLTMVIFGAFGIFFAIYGYVISV